jgi:ATP phosphoribosyltransferase
LRYLKIALSKGRLAELSLDLLERVGIDCSEYKDESRKLIFTDEQNMIKFFLVKPADVPTYVEYGAADIGIAGKDTLLEEGRHLYEVLNLGFAACKMVLAGPAELMGKLDRLNNKRVATKYPRIAREYFEHKRRESIEVIKLNGSVELAPLVGLSEVIVDLVESGRTLEENGLVILDTIADISARMVVNRVSMKMESERINRLIEGLKSQLKEIKCNAQGEKS